MSYINRPNYCYKKITRSRRVVEVTVRALNEAKEEVTFNFCIPIRHCKRYLNSPQMMAIFESKKRGLEFAGILNEKRKLKVYAMEEEDFCCEENKIYEEDIEA